jgi:hypothetical protein
MIEPVRNLDESKIGETITISFPAQPDLIVLARFAAATMAARAGFDVEEIEDLRLAVDELYVSLGPISEQGCIRMELACSDGTVSITGSFEPVSPHGPSTTEHLGDPSWQRAAELSQLLLDSLVDEHGGGIENGTPVAWLRKRRTATQ